MEQKAKMIHFIGIGGIGMSALAQYFNDQGVVVTGSDRDASPVTELLEKRGIRVAIGQKAENVPVDAGMVVYSDAVPVENPERARARELGIPELCYFKMLGQVAAGKRAIAVAGTHGKTTTTGMLAAILQHCKKEPTAIIGSIIKDFGSNFLAGRSDIFVVEACEYRDHVLKLSPEILVITNIELDHTDYFPNLEALQETFKKAAERVPKHGVIVTMSNDSNIAPILQNVSARIVDFSKCGTYEVPHLIGEFNKMNACAAAAAAQAAFPDISQEAIAIALKNFKGSWRRFEYRGETPSGALVYDDYAHHPTAIRKTLEAAREKFPHKKIVVAFHPHLYSRTKSFLNEFAEALSLADHAIVAPIYAAREEPDPEISNHTVADAARSFGGNVEAMDSFDEIRDRLLLEDEGTLIITMGAGDIYKIAEQIAD